MSNVFALFNPPVQRTPAALGDVHTIVSIFPKRIKEIKVTLDPGEFTIPAGSLEEPGVLHVYSSVHWRTMGADMEPAEVTTPSVIIADSIIKDYVNSLIEIKVGTSGPGLFYVEGKKTPEEIKKNHQNLLKAAEERQKRWFTSLVLMADSLWARSGGNPVAVPTDCKLAAEYLGLKTKPYLQDFNTLQMITCVNCGSMRNPKYPTCPSCHQVVDQKLFKELGLAAEVK